MTNSLQGAEAGVRRQVTIEKSPLRPVGVLFDDARGIDGAATTTARSGVVAYGNLVGSRIQGPVTYTYGQRGTITDSELTGALTLTDAETRSRSGESGAARLLGRRLEPRQPRQCRDGHRARRRKLVGLRDPDARTTGLVDLGTPATTAPAALSVPAATLDATPRARSSIRSGRPSSRWGETIYPVVVAADDFGVKSVKLTANGAPVATVGHTPYEFTYTPAYDQIGKHRHARGDDHRLLGPDERRLHRGHRPGDHDEHDRHRRRHRPGDARR